MLPLLMQMQFTFFRQMMSDWSKKCTLYIFSIYYTIEHKSEYIS